MVYSITTCHRRRRHLLERNPNVGWMYHSALAPQRRSFHHFQDHAYCLWISVGGCPHRDCTLMNRHHIQVRLSHMVVAFFAALHYEFVAVAMSY